MSDDGTCQLENCSMHGLSHVEGFYLLEMQHFEPVFTKLAPVKPETPVRQVEVNVTNQGILSGGNFFRGGSSVPSI